ncbi:MAG TPA: thioesterase family protein [Verrucomicrobiae bacterium]|nr:thioesterase family protein [Verrucomicrobiae bacterium]
MTPTPATPWSRLLAATREDAGQARLEVTDDWLQGRTVFGGLQAAIALRAMRTLVPDLPLRTLQGTFLAPVGAGTVRAAATVLRTGKSATHVEARIVDGDATLALLVGVFGAARESAVVISPRLDTHALTRSVEFPYVPGLTPAFTQHFKVRWLRGLPPFTGDTEVSHALEIGLRDAGPCNEGHVLALADFIPPLALSHLKKPAFGSSLTWMLEFLTGRFDRFALEGWRIDAHLGNAREGYTGQTVRLFGPGGEPVATSRQSMVVFG